MISRRRVSPPSANSLAGGADRGEVAVAARVRRGQRRRHRRQQLGQRLAHDIAGIGIRADGLAQEPHPVAGVPGLVVADPGVGLHEPRQQPLAREIVGRELERREAERSLGDQVVEGDEPHLRREAVRFGEEPLVRLHARMPSSSRKVKKTRKKKKAKAGPERRSSGPNRSSAEESYDSDPLMPSHGLDKPVTRLSPNRVWRPSALRQQPGSCPRSCLRVAFTFRVCMRFSRARAFDERCSLSAFTCPPATLNDTACRA